MKIRPKIGVRGVNTLVFAETLVRRCAIAQGSLDLAEISLAASTQAKNWPVCETADSSSFPEFLDHISQFGNVSATLLRWR